MSYSPVNVSNNVLRRAFDEGIDVSPMKLQKLLYFIASEYAKDNGNATLLNEQFKAWQYGPVLRSVYDEFRTFGGSPIRAFAKDAEGKAYSVSESSNPALARAINRVWDRAKRESAVDLSRLTHLDGSAWAKTYRALGTDAIPDSDVAADLTYRSRLGLA